MMIMVTQLTMVLDSANVFLATSVQPLEHFSAVLYAPNLTLIPFLHQIINKDVSVRLDIGSGRILREMDSGSASITVP